MPPRFGLAGGGRRLHAGGCFVPQRIAAAPGGKHNLRRLDREDRLLKRRKGLSWRDIAAQIGPGSPVYYTAALHGQMKLSKSEADSAGRVLGLDEDEVALLQEVPYRGSLPTAVPTDPLIYRFYDVAIERQPDQKGDRVRVTMSGKFLPYKQY